MTLDPQAKRVLDDLVALGVKPAREVPIEVGREALRLRRQQYAGPTAPVARVEDRTILGPGGPIPVRIYTPTGQGPWPVLLYFHGGGWVRGDLETVDALCRDLAGGAGCLTISVDYRRAPEHPFPAAADDCYAAAVWAAEHAEELGGDGSRLAVAGDSAGGNLAAAVALMARDRGGPRLSYQILIYPVTDSSLDTPSYHANADGYLLTRDNMAWFWEQYAPSPADAAHPYASPLRAADFSGLPPALVITAEYDPLRDEGKAYADRLTAAGVPTEYRSYPGQIHDFVGMAPVIDAGREAIQQMCQGLRRIAAS